MGMIAGGSALAARTLLQETKKSKRTFLIAELRSRTIIVVWSCSDGGRVFCPAVKNPDEMTRGLSS